MGEITDFYERIANDHGKFFDGLVRKINDEHIKQKLDKYNLVTEFFLLSFFCNYADYLYYTYGTESDFLTMFFHKKVYEVLEKEIGIRFYPAMKFDNIFPSSCLSITTKQSNSTSKLTPIKVPPILFGVSPSLISDFERQLKSPRYIGAYNICPACINKFKEFINRDKGRISQRIVSMNKLLLLGLILVPEQKVKIIYHTYNLFDKEPLDPLNSNNIPPTDRLFGLIYYIESDYEGTFYAQDHYAGSLYSATVLHIAYAEEYMFNMYLLCTGTHGKVKDFKPLSAVVPKQLLRIGSELEYIPSYFTYIEKSLSHDDLPQALKDLSVSCVRFTAGVTPYVIFIPHPLLAPYLDSDLIIVDPEESIMPILKSRRPQDRHIKNKLLSSLFIDLHDCKYVGRSNDELDSQMSDYYNTVVAKSLHSKA